MNDNNMQQQIDRAQKPVPTMHIDDKMGQEYATQQQMQINRFGPDGGVQHTRADVPSFQKNHFVNQSISAHAANMPNLSGNYRHNNQNAMSMGSGPTGPQSIISSNYQAQQQLHQASAAQRYGSVRMDPGMMHHGSGHPGVPGGYDGNNSMGYQNQGGPQSMGQLSSQNMMYNGAMGRPNAPGVHQQFPASHLNHIQQQQQMSRANFEHEKRSAYLNDQMYSRQKNAGTGMQMGHSSTVIGSHLDQKTPIIARTQQPGANQYPGDDLNQRAEFNNYGGTSLMTGLNNRPHAAGMNSMNGPGGQPAYGVQAASQSQTNYYSGGVSGQTAGRSGQGGFKMPLSSEGVIKKLEQLIVEWQQSRYHRDCKQNILVFARDHYEHAKLIVCQLVKSVELFCKQNRDDPLILVIDDIVKFVQGDFIEHFKEKLKYIFTLTWNNAKSRDALVKLLEIFNIWELFFDKNVLGSIYQELNLKRKETELLSDEAWVSINNSKKQFEPNLLLIPAHLIREKNFKCSEHKFNEVFMKFQQQNSNTGLGAQHDHRTKTAAHINALYPAVSHQISGPQPHLSRGYHDVRNAQIISGQTGSIGQSHQSVHTTSGYANSQLYNQSVNLQQQQVVQAQLNHNTASMRSQNDNEHPIHNASHAHLTMNRSTDVATNRAPTERPIGSMNGQPNRLDQPKGSDAYPSQPNGKTVAESISDVGADKQKTNHQGCFVQNSNEQVINQTTQNALSTVNKPSLDNQDPTSRAPNNISTQPPLASQWPKSQAPSHCNPKSSSDNSNQANQPSSNITSQNFHFANNQNHQINRNIGQSDPISGKKQSEYQVENKPATQAPSQIHSQPSQSNQQMAVNSIQQNHMIQLQQKYAPGQYHGVEPHAGRMHTVPSADTALQRVVGSQQSQELLFLENKVKATGGFLSIIMDQYNQYHACQRTVCEQQIYQQYHRQLYELLSHINRDFVGKGQPQATIVNHVQFKRFGILPSHLSRQLQFQPGMRQMTPFQGAASGFEQQQPRHLLNFNTLRHWLQKKQSIGHEEQPHILSKLNIVAITQLYQSIKFQCSNCGLRFLRNQDLRNHLDLHFAENNEIRKKKRIGPSMYPNLSIAIDAGAIGSSGAMMSASAMGTQITCTDSRPLFQSFQGWIQQGKGANGCLKTKSQVQNNVELKNIVPYSKSEDCCFICKEKLKIERDQCISSGQNHIDIQAGSAQFNQQIDENCYFIDAKRIRISVRNKLTDKLEKQEVTLHIDCFKQLQKIKTQTQTKRSQLQPSSQHVQNFLGKRPLNDIEHQTPPRIPEHQVPPGQYSEQRCVSIPPEDGKFGKHLKKVSDLESKRQRREQESGKVKQKCQLLLSGLQSNAV